MPDNIKDDAAERGRLRRLARDRKRDAERATQDAALRQRLSAVPSGKVAPARSSVAARPDSRVTGRERIVGDDGSVQVVATTAPTLLRLQSHRQHAAVRFCRDWESTLGSLHSAALEWIPRSTDGNLGPVLRVEAAQRLRAVREHVGSGGFAILTVLLVVGMSVADLAKAAGTTTADVHRDLNDALDAASNVYGATHMSRLARKCAALVEPRIAAVVSWRAA
jgi:hypothetical protein